MTNHHDQTFLSTYFLIEPVLENFVMHTVPVFLNIRQDLYRNTSIGPEHKSKLYFWLILLPSAWKMIDMHSNFTMPIKIPHREKPLKKYIWLLLQVNKQPFELRLFRE